MVRIREVRWVLGGGAFDENGLEGWGDWTGPTLIVI